MSQKKRIDKILDVVEPRIAEEVGALLGGDFTVSGEERCLVTKEQAFDQLKGKQISASLEVVGEVEGKGCLLIGIKDAIRLGGTLIMLPGSELDEVVGREDYSEEIEDSYGEIANIVAGVFTKDFEEMFPRTCRFVRKEQEILIPAKVDIGSEHPVADEPLYLIPMDMSLDGVQMGRLIMLIPAGPFDIEGDVKSDEVAPPVEPEISADGESESGSEAAKLEESMDAALEAVPEKPRKFDYARHKKRVDALLTECRDRMAQELGALLAVEVGFSDDGNSLVSKEEYFDEYTAGRQVFADMEVVGDLEDCAYFCLSLKNCVQLGGILIMLPPNELEIAIAEEAFTEDTKDAYGEVANIVSGVYTAVFEEQYIKKLRFIKKGLQEVIPVKVDIDSDTPMPDGQYYIQSMFLTVEGQQIGKVQMVFPAELLSLAKEGSPEKHETAEVEQQPQSVAETPVGETVKKPVVSDPKKLPVDTLKHQKKVNKLLSLCMKQMKEELSSLVGNEVVLSNLENKVIDKENFFFEAVSKKQVIADFEVTGDVQGVSYLSIDLRDAIRLGGELIMLPASELEAVVAEEDLVDDAKDAYGEITNIIAGVYTAIFEEQYIQQLRFIKKELHKVVPMKVDIESDEPFPDQYYYLSQMDVRFGGAELGKMYLLFPLALLQLTGLVETEQEAVAVEEQSQDKQKRSDESTQRSLDILIVGDDELEANNIRRVLERQGFGVECLSFKDDIHRFLPGQLKAVYLVMRDVNEQAFGVAIKVSTVSSVPVIAAGPGWTRTKVIKAVKYGVRDIILTPAEEQDIEENINNNLIEMAA